MELSRCGKCHSCKNLAEQIQYFENYVMNLKAEIQRLNAELKASYKKS